MGLLTNVFICSRMMDRVEKVVAMYNYNCEMLQYIFTMQALCTHLCLKVYLIHLAQHAGVSFRDLYLT